MQYIVFEEKYHHGKEFGMKIMPEDHGIPIAMD
jgi:hypothetical protein